MHSCVGFCFRFFNLKFYKAECLKIFYVIGLSVKFWDKNYFLLSWKILHHCFLGLLWWRCLMLSRFLSLCKWSTFFSLEDHSIFSLSLVLSDFLMVCLAVSCFLFTVMDLFQSENSCLQFWNIFLKIISLRILLVSFFFLIISVIRILNFLSRTLIFFVVSTFLPFFLIAIFSVFAKIFSNS